MTLVPAYGRDYKSKAAVLADFQADKDFLIADAFHPGEGKPANRPSLLAAKVKTVNVRYARLTKVAVIKVG